MTRHEPYTKPSATADQLKEDTMTTTHRPGTVHWCEEGGRIRGRIGSLTVYMSMDDIERWNCGEFDYDVHKIRCHIPISQPGRSFVRDGEVVTNPGLPDDWYGTLEQAVNLGLVDDLEYDDCMASECVVA